MIVQLVGEVTILGVTLHFHPLIQAFVKAFVPLSKVNFVISEKLKAELSRPTVPGDPTAIVPEYKLDWWKGGPAKYPDLFGLRQLEDAYMFHFLQASPCLFSILLNYNSNLSSSLVRKEAYSPMP